MLHVTVGEGEGQLTTLVDAIASGRETEITIALNGKPAARLVPIEPARPRLQLGLAEGKFTFDYEAFQALDAEVLKLFKDSARESPLPSLD